MTPWLTDAELQDATHRRKPGAQARALDAMGIPWRRRPDGSLLVGREALAQALLARPPAPGVASPLPAANGCTWSKHA